MSLLSVLDRVSSHVPEDFIAPVPQANTVMLYSLQDSIMYKFMLRNPVPGWWNIKPRSKTDAVISDMEILPYQKLEYLADLPRFYVIALFPVNNSTWLVSPYNLSDADQRGWINGHPQNIYLCQGNIQPLTVLIARKLGNILLFENINTRVSSDHVIDLEYKPKEKSFQHALDIVLRAMEEQDRRAKELEQQKIDIERQKLIRERLDDIRREAEWQLGFSGANMLNFRELQSGYEVSWEYNGARFTVETMSNLQVESAGICLNSTDRRYNLSNIVQVMEEARRRNRFDMDEDLWI